MPELPEVEVVRHGLDQWVTGRTIGVVSVLHQRAVRRHAGGQADFCARLSDRRVAGVFRRGKYLWLALDSGEALLAHLGMSGQLLVQRPQQSPERHLRALLRLDASAETEVRFVDQRTFGHLLVDPLVADGGTWVPSTARHIARDPLEPEFDEDAVAAALARRRSDIKRALLDQSLISGIGNIYADEALWRVRLHGGQHTGSLCRSDVADLMVEVRAVMRDALAAGGTSFDELYVNVNGESGYFERGLNVYGREGLPCARCATPIRRSAFMNRSSYDCPRCQPLPDGAKPA